MAQALAILSRDEKHHGVGVLVTNKNKDLFYIQQKDEQYPIAQFKLCYSFFGGEKNKDETEENALERELREELESAAAVKISRLARKIGDFELTSNGNPFTFTLYEAVLAEQELKELAGLPIKEGKRGALFDKDNITKLKFVHNLETVLRAYLTQLQ